MVILKEGSPQLCSGLGSWALVEKLLRWIRPNTFDDKSTCVHVTAWRRQGTGHYLWQCWPRCMSQHDVARPQFKGVTYEYYSVSQAIRLFVQRRNQTENKDILKALKYWPFECEYISDLGFAAQRANKVKLFSCPDAMVWNNLAHYRSA